MNPGFDELKGIEEPIEYPCDCLPDCVNYYYPIEASEAMLAEDLTSDDEFIR